MSTFVGGSAVCFLGGEPAKEDCNTHKWLTAENSVVKNDQAPTVCTILLLLFLVVVVAVVVVGSTTMKVRTF